MILSTSFLMIENNKKKIEELNQFTDYMHYDIMDGLFTDKATNNYNDLLEITQNVSKPKDVHLMVLDIKKYTDLFSKINPDYITFHLEATDKHKEIIRYIKEKGIKVGMALNPKTHIEEIIPYLNSLDLVLVMSVKAGAGGQKFIDVSDKIEFLNKYRKEHNLNYLIEVDGGINPDVINKIKQADMIVVGSFITNGDIQIQINKIRSLI